jgi:hypothetical protein
MSRRRLLRAFQSKERCVAGKSKNAKLKLVAAKGGQGTDFDKLSGQDC